MGTDHISKLETRRVALIKEIAGAATVADSAQLISLADELKEVDRLTTRFKSLAEEADAVLKRKVGRPAEREEMHDARVLPIESRIPGRGSGAEIRSAFVRKARERGIQLSPYRGAVLVTAERWRVGIAVATERHPDRWFLGLPENGFDAAVLLCQTISGEVLEVCLPDRFFERFGPNLSRSGGQLKFNVARRNGQVSLTLPGRGPFTVDDLLGDISQLRPTAA